MRSDCINSDDIETIATTYFKFESDFMENNIRCIPMIVRFKLDAAGIKLKLFEWSRFNVEDREQLVRRSCDNSLEVANYREYLYNLVINITGNAPTELLVDANPAWANMNQVDASLQAKAREYDWHISLSQWIFLSDLQRFALLKLYRPGHENKNFPKAMREFKLI